MRRASGLRHTYEVPVPQNATFAWRQGYAEGGSTVLHARHYYAVEGRLDGLGYMATPDGELAAAPVIFANRGGGRLVALDFDPQPGFWSTASGQALIRRAVTYASRGSDVFSVETLFSTLRPGESPRSLCPSAARSCHHLPGAGRGRADAGRQAGRIRHDSASCGRSGPVPDSLSQAAGARLLRSAGELARRRRAARGVSQRFSGSRLRRRCTAGLSWGVAGDGMTRDGQPFLPVGTNYFTTAENGWDFSGPRNAATWEHDFAAMQAHGVSFVRTGVWMPNARFIDGDLGAVNERFLRNLEAFLLSAQRHKIAVNFTFFAFAPKVGTPRPEDPPQDPYLDPYLLRSEQAYVRSVVAAFRAVPFLSWDLINEPSVTNPAHVFSGNYPLNDSLEQAAWHTWLRAHYPTLEALAAAWTTTPERLTSFDSIPVPAVADLTYNRYGNPRQVRALDYNLFAQDLFRDWAAMMVRTIHETGSTQLVDVGQDEGGVTNRVLNHFYASAGLSFTTNHTYWEDDSLLWDSVAAKVNGTPNITGETGYQPAWSPDGAWRYDELTGVGLTERKWALGFAAGSTGAMQWDWAREVDFGMERSDGSAKVWEQMMRDLGHFATDAAPYAAHFELPETAIVLPQSLQLSVYNSYALQAQQTAVRALYQQAHGAAYSVGEYQVEKELGTPKLILLPSPMGLSEPAWEVIEARVRSGATLLITGPFDADQHFHELDRRTALGLPYTTQALQLREQKMSYPGSPSGETFTFPGKTTTVLTQATMPNGETWHEAQVGQGRILLAAFPLELSQNLPALGRVYAYAMQQAHVAPSVTTPTLDPGILVCPTEYAAATLYVITSETASTTVTFHDRRSNRDFSSPLAAGRAALLMIGTDGKVLASYHWN